VKFHEYLESRYTLTNLENQKAYSPAKQAETTAIHDLTNGQKKFYKYIAYFKVIFGYFFMKLTRSPGLPTPKEIFENYKRETEKKPELTETVDDYTAVVTDTSEPLTH
jgi:hypothetical protein